MSSSSDKAIEYLNDLDMIKARLSELATEIQKLRVPNLHAAITLVDDYINNEVLELIKSVTYPLVEEIDFFKADIHTSFEKDRKDLEIAKQAYNAWTHIKKVIA